MHTVTTKIPSGIYSKLEDLASATDRKKSYIIRKALTEYIEDYEDYVEASDRLKDRKPTYSLEEVEKICDLEN